MTKLSLKIQGVRGNSAKWIEQIGYVSIFPMQQQSSFIVVDAYEGEGKNYKKRGINNIEIHNQGEKIFEGSFADLVSIITKATVTKEVFENSFDAYNISYTWTCDQFGDKIPEAHKEALKEDAESRIFEMLKEGYHSGELFTSIRLGKDTVPEEDEDDGLTYSGWWAKNK